MPRVLQLTRPYALELIGKDNGERYADVLEYVNHRPLPSPGPCCWNLPPELADYLAAGTGLEPDHATALRLLEAGGKVRGWQAIALQPPGHILRPSWHGGEDRDVRIYASRPPLQNLAKPYRISALYPHGASDGFAEIDFRCCHPNIARILAGLPTTPDLYGELAALAGLHREDVKALVIPILGGQTRAHFIFTHGRIFVELYDQIRRAMRDILCVPGERLKELEAETLRSVLRRMRAAGIPAGLPVHDSILTAYPAPVAVFMSEESERILGRPLPVRISPAGPELLQI